MRGLPERIMEHAKAFPEATPLSLGALLHLGNRASVDQALARLSRSGKLVRISHGVYMRPIETRFGTRNPSIGKVIAALSELWGETIVPCGGAAANRLGLTTQNPFAWFILLPVPTEDCDSVGIPLIYAILLAGSL